MGFFSFVGSCISHAASFVGSAVSAVGRTVGKVVTGVARFAGKVLTTVASVGEKVIKTVKTVWPVVKPWVAKFANALIAVPVVGPYLAVAAKTLLALENSPILKKIASVAERVLPKMKKIGIALTKWSDIQKAKEDQEILEEGEAEMRSNEEKCSLRMAQIINKFIIVNSTIQKMIEEDKAVDLDSYLRIRADARILEKIKDRLTNIKSLDEVSADDLFVLNFSDKVINEEDVSAEDADRFAELVEKMFGKSVMAIVFDEMIKQWAADLEVDREKEKKMFAEWNSSNVIFKRFSRLEADNLLSDEEMVEFKGLKDKLPRMKENLDEVQKSIGHRQFYIEAAEGMLCVYEGDKAIAEVVGEDEIDIIKENVEDVGQLIIECMNRGKEWESLTEDEQGLIMDFSNIFRKSAQNRAKEVVEVIGGAC
ncbi:hypothetical protein [Fibrobacter intestinalis]|uniref:Uncharacterized protein n=1 Tax=Fibrobacter intestinalis TaxID=28122 RepID=A0A1T4RDA4_9BACT|nr:MULTISPECIES: hypothetical protein [Fibrobacter]PBC73514.1 hypothetical protein BGW94_1123 [Fibrobacter sp. NR9]SKA14004.1 hypothetical protein SAMN02745108_02662 [Fibrobacter intestinalis]